LNGFQKIIAFIYFLNIQIMPNNFGVSFSPFLGLQTANSLITLLSSFLGAFYLVLIAAAVLIGLIYAIFPLFLYVGIVLRSIPWTRAAGGSFLGVFLGFYIVFPLILFSMLGAYNTVFSSQSGGAIGNIGSVSDYSGILAGQGSPSFNPVAILSSIGSFFTNAESGLSTILTQGVLQYIGTDAIQPFAYTGFSLIIAFVISFDFIDAAGDLLGAPSLSSDTMLKKII
ncbi:MAG: hypothetical protein KGH66_01110, partial [Candidatus Micrarchaeota archaeon]|nr:hypothetical protein [Candidatus Micrarchaeota archaeon]